MSLDVALHMASCYEAVTQQASEMQADVNKIDAKSATTHVTLLTTGNPPKRKKRENFGNAETRDTYLRMKSLQCGR